VNNHRKTVISTTYATIFLSGHLPAILVQKSAIVSIETVRITRQLDQGQGDGHQVMRTSSASRQSGEGKQGTTRIEGPDGPRKKQEKNSRN
jgi:hypothetical protein